MMVVPVLLFASGVVAVSVYGWLVLAFVILAGGWITWWATEQAWAKFL